MWLMSQVQSDLSPDPLLSSLRGGPETPRRPGGQNRLTGQPPGFYYHGKFNDGGDIILKGSYFFKVAFCRYLERRLRYPQSHYPNSSSGEVGSVSFTSSGVGRRRWSEALWSSWCWPWSSPSSSSPFSAAATTPGKDKVTRRSSQKRKVLQSKQFRSSVQFYLQFTPTLDRVLFK